MTPKFKSGTQTALPHEEIHVNDDDSDEFVELKESTDRKGNILQIKIQTSVYEKLFEDMMNGEMALG